MTTTQHLGGDVIDSEAIDITTGEQLISAQRGAPPGPPAAPRDELKPLLASWLKDRDAFTEKVTAASKRAAHSTAWHTLHALPHVLRVLKFVPHGLWRVVRVIWDWVFDAEAKPLRQEAVAKNDPDKWLKLAKERKERIHRRWIGLLVLAVLVLVGLLLLWALLPS